MGKINVLDFQVANLIAAGEVVDRPASVIKELAENAIDAGATEVVIEIKNGGISFMRVTDNGCGMSKEDVPIAVKRHATSKIKNASDLDGIMTLGFRGEALAAIASVSKLRIMTKPHNDEIGTLLVSVGGEVTEVSEMGCRNGTTVIVEDLFYNVPARRKFLKRDISEGMAVAAVAEKIALSHPEIAVKLISDGNQKFATAGDKKLLNTIYAVLGREFASKLCEIKGLSDGIEVTGYVGSPINIRSNRNYQNFFINGRYIKSKTAMAALEQAFDSFIPHDKFPCCVLRITIHPALVDVNVHPTKLEVKFSNERIVFDAVYCAVRNALMQKLSRPELVIEPHRLSKQDIKAVSAFVPVNDGTSGENVKKAETTKISFEVVKEPSIPHNIYKPHKVPPADTGSAKHFEDEPDISVKLESGSLAHSSEVIKHSVAPTDIAPDTSKEQNNETAASEPSEAVVQTTVKPYFKLLGEAFNSYVFVEHEGKVIVIDKHAAHERIIFEEMKNNMKSSKSSSQILMVPYDITLDNTEIAALLEYRDDLFSIGYFFTVDEVKKEVSVSQIPSMLDVGEAADMLTEICGKLSEMTGTPGLSRDIVYEKALYQGSCKAAIKAGREYTRENIEWICEKLLSLPNIKYCPHGRPVAFEMSKAEMEKHFKRI